MCCKFQNIEYAPAKQLLNACFICLFDLILYVPSTIFQLNREGPSWVEPVLSYDKCVLLKGHNAMTPVRLEPVAPDLESILFSQTQSDVVAPQKK